MVTIFDLQRIAGLNFVFQVIKQTMFLESFVQYRQPGWIGTDGVNRDTGLEPGDTPTEREHYENSIKPKLEQH